MFSVDKSMVADSVMGLFLWDSVYGISYGVVCKEPPVLGPPTRWGYFVN